MPVIYLPDLSGKPLPQAAPLKHEVEDILQGIMAKYDISRDDLTGKKRLQNHYTARQEAAYLLLQHTSLSLMDIGRLLKKDHTTIIHAIGKFCTKHDLPLPRNAKWKKRGGSSNETGDC